MRFVLLDDQGSGKQFCFRNPKRVITANCREDLPRAFSEIDAAQNEGKWLAGWMSYELGHGLETRFDAPDAPLIQFGVFDAPSDTPPVDWLYTQDVPELTFKPIWTEDDYLSRFQRVQDYLRAGDCYQVNLTFPMFADSEASTTQLYAAFRRRQPGRYGAIVSLGETEIISFSPELFFERKGQAENLMIVDLLRNDLSRLCVPGSVKVPELFTLETYPTLHQMTSQVTGTLKNDVSWEQILRSLFPMPASQSPFGPSRNKKDVSDMMWVPASS